MKRKSLTVIAIGALVVIAAAIGVMKYNDTAQASKTIKEKVDIGGYGLNVRAEGKGTPTVIFESGLGGWLNEWVNVKPEISKITRTFSYDRAGLGASDKSTLPRTSLNQVKELHTLLERSKVKGPYIIVAHSIGGLNARLFADNYPKEVAGIVFVDSTHEENLNVFKSKYPEDFENLKANYRSTEGNFQDLLISTDQVRETRKKDTLRNIPIIVLSSDISVRGNEDPLFTAELPKLQADIATLSDKSKLITVEKAGHAIHNDNPKAVIDAIKELIETVKNK